MSPPARAFRAVMTKTNLIPTRTVIDGSGQVLGRLAARVSRILQGKERPDYKPGVDYKETVVIVNAKDIIMTGKKMDQKVLRHHTGHPGGLKEVLAKDIHTKEPTQLIRRAVSGMLPKNKLRVKRNRRLRVFEGVDVGKEPLQA
eukprot:TRINITY_DN2382_c0_g2_i1.p1 TRINITY_DN2382_c0_g2~~TRINITY_DN2382_c0_g2_i1.p1  ORF type:complete len:144 (+),score=12.23 TRINITY_DN2382_c0_g2_i1:128-559(+)